MFLNELLIDIYKMIKKVVSLLFLFLISTSYGQVVDSLRKEHTKKKIYTLKPGETFPYNESKMMVTNKSVDVEFYISDTTNKWSYCKNGNIKYDVPFLFYSGFFNNEPVIVISEYVNNSKLQSLLLKNGTKIGPFESVWPVFVVENNSHILQGYITKSVKGETYIDLKTNIKYGPFTKIKEVFYNKNGVMIAYHTNQKHFVLLNNKLFGPYLDTKLAESYMSNKNIEHFWFKDSISLQKNYWKLNFKNKIITDEFKNCPTIYYLKNGSISYTIYKQVNGKSTECIVSNNVDYPKEHNKIFQYQNNQGNVLTLVRKGSNFSNLFTSYFDNVKQSEIKKSISWNCQTAYSSYFPVVFEDSIDENKLIIPGVNKQLIISNKNEIRDRKIFIYNDDLMFIDKIDSTLYLNGVATQHKHVLEIIPAINNEYIIMKKDGYFSTFFCKDKVLNLSELKANSLHRDYNLHIENKANTLMENNKRFILTNQGKNKFGPFEYDDFRTYEVSENGLHYAYHNFNKNQIVIDGKIIGDGNNLIYNETLNAFQWLEIDNNSLIQHTYMLN